MSEFHKNLCEKCFLNANLILETNVKHFFLGSLLMLQLSVFLGKSKNPEILWQNGYFSIFRALDVRISQKFV
jgi:hypothetical protein